MKKFLGIILFTVVVSFADSTTFSLDTMVVDTTKEWEMDTKPLTKEQKRYKVVSSVMMMVFLGIILGTTQSNNPE